MKIKNFGLPNFIFLCLFLLACRNKNDSGEIKIGSQTWTTKNLDVNTFNNGDIITEAKTNEEWDKAGNEGRASWCYYDNLDENGKQLGKLYNWYAVNDPRGLAPKGWHIPRADEWQKLIDYLGGEQESGVKIKSTKGWHKNNNSTNESGFSGLPAGVRMIGELGMFYGVGAIANWWSSTGITGDDAKYSRLDDLDNSILSVTNASKRFGMSVRCIKN